ncbi:MAG: hypothetical protein WBQ78_08090 [Gammaproteobacteria bacterium]
MSNYRLLTIVLVGLLLSACAQFTPYRTAIPNLKSADFQPFECAVDQSVVDRKQNGEKEKDKLLPDGLCEIRKSAGHGNRKCTDPESRNHVECQAIQHRFYQTEDGQEGDYYLSFVEFDDQGWFADREQMKALFALLEDLEKKDKETGGHILIQVYAHGWKHNASACDNNVLCFSRLLERTDLAEKNKAVMRYMLTEIPKLTEEERRELKEQTPEDAAKRLMLKKSYSIMQIQLDISRMPPEEQKRALDKIKPRTVVGVYLGWRGLPFDTALNNLSFWSRKDTAARVGSGGVFELLTRLKDYRDIRQRDESADTDKTQLVITGHSFGGLVIYSALSRALMERATKTSRPTKANECPDPATEYGIAKSYGDFVFLVNPAFEGSLYEPLFNIATNRCYEEKQPPVMMIVTSNADKATGIAFPIGRTLDTLFQHKGSAEQGDSMRETIGHNERYKTHDLTFAGDRNRLDDEYIEKSACDCPHLRPTSELTLDQMQGDSFDAMLNENYGNGLCLKPVSSPKYASNYPYLVVTTDADVIADHNAIYNGNFTLFAQQFFQKHIALEQPLPLPTDPLACWREQSAASGLVPAERSCNDKGESCSGQTPTN